MEKTVNIGKYSVHIRTLNHVSSISIISSWRYVLSAFDLLWVINLISLRFHTEFGATTGISSSIYDFTFQLRVVVAAAYISLIVSSTSIK